MSNFRLSNTRQLHEARETQEAVHIPTDHDRLAQERYNERIEALRQAGEITLQSAEWLTHHYTVDTDWTPPDAA